MRCRLIVRVVVFFCVFPSFGGRFADAFQVPGDKSDYRAVEHARSLVLDGMQQLYNFDVEGAEKRFNEAINEEPRYPRPYLSRALAPLWKSFVSRADSDYAEAISLLTETIERGVTYLDDVNDKDADVLACLGTAYGYRTYIHFVRKSYLKAAWDAKQSYGYLAEAVQADSQCYDAYLGLGMYHFSVATIPKPLQWIMGVLGVDGDRDLGIREIELAAKKGTFNAVEAKFFLMQLYPWYKGDFEVSEKMSDELIREYPANTVFLYVKGFMKLRRDDVAEAMPYFLRMREVENPYFVVINKFAEFRLGDCYFRLGDYARSKAAYQAFLRMNNGGQFEAVASYQAALATEMLGNRKAALPLYRRAKNFQGEHGDDIYAARHAGKLLLSRLSMVDSLIIIGRNYSRAGKSAKAIAVYTDLLTGYSMSNDERAEVLYRLGECYYDAERFDDAAEQFRAVTGLKVNLEVWVVPWSHYMLGQIALKRGDVATAKQEFAFVDEYDNYDHKNWLTFRVERQLEKLAPK